MLIAVRSARTELHAVRLTLLRELQPHWNTLLNATRPSFAAANQVVTLTRVTKFLYTFYKPLYNRLYNRLDETIHITNKKINK